MTPHRTSKLRFLPLTGGALALLLAACTEVGNHQAAPVAKIDAPAVSAEKAADLHGVHNVVTYAPDMICGAVPEGAAGLATLKAMGVKTIVSVDGATPEAELAEALGMHYIHLPISYDSVPEARAKELAQVLANAEGPVYMHCHHGKHRSAAALGSALVLVGKLTPEQAEARMKVSGTSADYQGLWDSVRESKPMAAADLKADLAAFPSISKVSGLVALMNELDVVFDNVKAAQGAAWGVPKNHPDLVPQKETKRLANIYLQLKTEPESVAHPADYQQMLEKSIRAAEALDAAVRSGDQATASAQYAIVQKGCKECHKSYRDKR